MPNSIAYFDSAGSMMVASTGDDQMVKNALILVEGEHADNQGVIHQFPIERIQRLVDNTNKAISLGREIPLMIDHSKVLVSGGELKKLGKLQSQLENRIIAASDLSDPKMSDLIGKRGVFGKFLIQNRLSDIKKGLINLLSPGIDLLTESFQEISAVAFPAMRGPALFSLDYTEAKEQQGLIRKLKDDAQECFDILFGVIKDIESTNPDEMIGISLNALKRKAAEDFFNDLLTVLGLSPDVTTGATELETPQDVTANPYGPLQQQYSQYSNGNGVKAVLKKRKGR